MASREKERDWDVAKSRYVIHISLRSACLWKWESHMGREIRLWQDQIYRLRTIGLCLARIVHLEGVHLYYLTFVGPPEDDVSRLDCR